MVWTQETAQGHEAAKCRPMVAGLLNGIGLDLGCGEEKIVSNAIGIDIQKPADIILDLSKPRALAIFADASMDFVFSSHLLEHMVDVDGTLEEWWRVIKPGGVLVLYCPDPDYYPRVGQYGSNPDHEHDFYWQEIWEIIEQFGNAELVHASTHNEDDQYSWLLVVKKTDAIIQDRSTIFRLAETLPDTGIDPSKIFTMPLTTQGLSKLGDRVAVVVRYGAIGDMVWTTPVLRKLKADGYKVMLVCRPDSAKVLAYCPWIDYFWMQQPGQIERTKLVDYFDRLAKQVKPPHRFINLTGSVEGRLLIPEGSQDDKLDHLTRHTRCNINYVEATIEAAGFDPKEIDISCQLHLSPAEERLLAMLLAPLEDKFVILWSLSGSAFHKAWPFVEYVCGDLYRNKPDTVRVITVGDAACQIFEPSLPNVLRKAGTLDLRLSLGLAKYADLVVGPETGILNAAAAFGTPIVIMLSHSSIENICKHWTNYTALEPEDCACHPCHRLIFNNSCPKGPLGLAPKCCEGIGPERVYDAIMEWYRKWHTHQAPYDARKKPGWKAFGPSQAVIQIPKGLVKKKVKRRAYAR